MAHESIVNLTEENFDAEIAAGDTPVLVDFWAEWCGPCRMIAPVLDEIAAEKGDAVKICKVNVDEAAGLSDRFQVRAIPTILLFKGGEVVDQIVGMTSKGDLVSKLEAQS